MRRMCDYHKDSIVVLLCHNQADKKRCAEIFVPYLMTISITECKCDMRYLDFFALYKDPVVVSFANDSRIYIITPEDNMHLPKKPELLVYSKYVTEDDIHSTLASIKALGGNA